MTESANTEAVRIVDKAVSSQLGALTTTADPLLRKPVLTQALTNGDSDALLRTHVLSQALTSGDSDPLLRKPVNKRGRFLEVVYHGMKATFLIVSFVFNRKKRTKYRNTHVL